MWVSKQARDEIIRECLSMLTGNESEEGHIPASGGPRSSHSRKDMRLYQTPKACSSRYRPLYARCCNEVSIDSWIGCHCDGCDVRRGVELCHP